MKLFQTDKSNNKKVDFIIASTQKGGMEIKTLEEMLNWDCPLWLEYSNIKNKLSS